MFLLLKAKQHLFIPLPFPLGTKGLLASVSCDDETVQSLSSAHDLWLMVQDLKTDALKALDFAHLRPLKHDCKQKFGIPSSNCRVVALTCV